MKPNMQVLGRALQLVGFVLDRPMTYRFDGRFAFELDAGWELSISPDDAGRFRVDARYGQKVRATMWCLAHDTERLAELARAAMYEAAAIAA